MRLTQVKIQARAILISELAKIKRLIEYWYKYKVRQVPHQ